MHARIRTDTYHVAEVQSLVETPALTGGSLARQTERFDGVFISNPACNRSCLRETALTTWSAGEGGAAGWEEGG